MLQTLGPGPALDGPDEEFGFRNFNFEIRNRHVHIDVFIIDKDLCIIFSLTTRLLSSTMQAGGYGLVGKRVLELSQIWFLIKLIVSSVLKCDILS